MFRFPKLYLCFTVVLVLLINCGETNENVTSPAEPILFIDQNRVTLATADNGLFPTDITSFQVDDERLFLLDTMQSQAFVYDRSGSLEYLVGGKGEGPGEYMLPGGFCKSGDRLHLIASRRQYQLYDLNGEPVGSSEEVNLSGIPNRLYPGADGTVYVTIYSRYAPEASIQQVDSKGHVLQAFSKPGEVFLSFWDQVSPAHSLVVLEDELIQSFVHRYQLLFFSLEGELLRRQPLSSDIYIKPDYDKVQDLPKRQGASREFFQSHTSLMGVYRMGDQTITQLHNTSLGVGKTVLEFWDQSFQRIGRLVVADDEEFLGVDGESLVFYNADAQQLIWRSRDQAH